MNALHVLTAIVMTGCFDAVLTAATQPSYHDKPVCTETDLSCRETQGNVLCVYKHINGVSSPQVFIDYKKASSSQYVRLFVRGRYYNATGAQNCSEDSHNYYYAGMLLIQPQSLPAHVEVSFTKNRTSTTPGLCNADSFPSYNTTVVKQGSCSYSASTCIQHEIKANLAQVARLLDTVSELLTQ